MQAGILLSLQPPHRGTGCAVEPDWTCIKHEKANESMVGDKKSFFDLSPPSTNDRLQDVEPSGTSLTDVIDMRSEV